MTDAREAAERVLEAGNLYDGTKYLYDQDIRTVARAYLALLAAPTEADVERVARTLAERDYERDIWDELPQTEDEAFRKYRLDDIGPITPKDEYLANARAAIAAWNNNRANPIRSEPPTEADVEFVVSAAQRIVDLDTEWRACEIDSTAQREASARLINACLTNAATVARAAIAALRKDG